MLLGKRKANNLHLEEIDDRNGLRECSPGKQRFKQSPIMIMLEESETNKENIEAN
jgi:hypothetical protein